MRSWVSVVVGTAGRLPLWLLPLLIAVAFFLPTGPIQGTSDGLSYADSALSLYQGKGLANPDGSPRGGRPLFPLLIAASYHLFGLSAYSAFLTARVFYLLNPLVIYFLGQQLYGRWAGLLASLLVLTSYSLNTWSGLLHLDHVMPFFVLLALLFTVLAFERRSYMWFAAAGIAYGLAYLTKELAILFFPLPALLLALVPAYRRRVCLLGTLLLFGTAALVVVPWLVYASSLQAGQVLGSTASYAARSFARGSSLLDSLGGMLLALPNYYRTHLQPNSVLAPLIVAGWGYALIMAVRGNRSGVFMSIVLLLFLPMVLFQGRVGFRSRQATVFFQLGYLALAGFLWALAGYLYSRPVRSSGLGRARLHWKLLAVLIPALVLALQASSAPTGHLKAYARSFGTVSSLVEKETHPLVDDLWLDWELAEWLRENVPPGSSIMATDTTGRYAYFLTEGDYAFWHFPYVNSDRVKGDAAQDGGATLTLLTTAFGNHQQPAAEYLCLRALTEQSLRDLIGEAGIDYVVLVGEVDHVSYFMDSPSFVKVADFGEGYMHVFEVQEKDIRPLDYDPVVGPDVETYLDTVQRSDPEHYAAMRDGFLKEQLGWTDAQILRVGDYVLEELSDKATVNDYVSSKSRQGELAEAIALHQRKADATPDNPWPQLTLAALRAAAGDHEASLDRYRQAAGAAPDRITAYLARGDSYRSALAPEARGEALVFPVDRLLDRGTGRPAGGSDPDHTHIGAFLVAGEPMGVLFQHPPSATSYSVRPSWHATLDFGLALAPEVWREEKGDGVVFDLYIDDGQARWLQFSEYIDPKDVLADRRWHDRSIDLSPWSGQVITLTFATEAGPAGDSDFDWAGWGEPRVMQPIDFDFLIEFPNADTGPGEGDRVRLDAFTIEREPRHILFQHPTSRVLYKVGVPERAGLHFAVGLDPRAWDPEKGDGVEYSIYVRDPDRPEVLQRVFNRYIDPKNDAADRRWHDAVVDLTPYGGRTVDIIFEALAGPAGDDSYDWGGWSWPVLVGDDLALAGLPVGSSAASMGDK